MPPPKTATRISSFYVVVCLGVGVPVIGVGFLAAMGTDQPLPDVGADTVTAAFHQAVRGHRMLFVLNDARGSQQVRALLPAKPMCLVIAASRHLEFPHRERP